MLTVVISGQRNYEFYSHLYVFVLIFSLKTIKEKLDMHKRC